MVGNQRDHPSRANTPPGPPSPFRRSSDFRQPPPPYCETCLAGLLFWGGFSETTNKNTSLFFGGWGKGGKGEGAFFFLVWGGGRWAVLIDGLRPPFAGSRSRSRSLDRSFRSSPSWRRRSSPGARWARPSSPSCASLGWVRSGLGSEAQWATSRARGPNRWVGGVWVWCGFWFPKEGLGWFRC